MRLIEIKGSLKMDSLDDIISYKVFNETRDLDYEYIDRFLRIQDDISDIIMGGINEVNGYKE
ncbi:MAG: hypothetical protein WC554_18735 [Clostridia bacterium]